ncbi:hypothetical protein GCM10010191_12560 [Actinomadura vinacea]|uniref:NACHT domain-containing protein n=1 Tax=Actinomadura vinacea TaxID=115336 RepID=A0ABN3IIQ7_9ACTN
MDYDLDRLGWRQMEHLAESLVLNILGNGVSVFGDGPDGGREAVFDGPIKFPEPDPGGPWNGYGVVQVKHRTHSRGRSDNVQWLQSQIREEVNEWLDPKSKRGKLPDYFLVITNVGLSPEPETGGWAKIEKYMREKVLPRLPFKGWRIWDYTTLSRLLDDTSDIVRSYYGLITPGDVLARLHDYVTGLAPDLGDTLLTHAAKELLAEQSVTLGQAGDREEGRLALNRVAVDLPAEWHDQDVKVVAHVLKRGEISSRPNDDGTSHRPLVVLGGPGQGKTTVAQLICQAYRVAQLLDVEDDRLPAEVRALRDEFVGDIIGKLGIAIPDRRRWPFHVRLDRYADALAKNPDLTLLHFIAERVSKRSVREVTAAQMVDWLARWPWVLILDGMDEVSDPHDRDRILGHIQDFRVEAAYRTADLLLLVTTRPQGYLEEFPSEKYDHLSLRPLSTAEALGYAERLAEARHPADGEQRQEVLRRVGEAATEEQASRLMRSPLQVTIMTLLLERRRRPPQHRFGLFKGYYDTVFAREVAKRTVDAGLLDRHDALIHQLQAEAGLLLQARSEREGEAEAALPLDNLRALAARLLREEDNEADVVDDLSTRLVDVAGRRLVLLTPRPNGGFGFEVRSLQEFMAARALLSDSDPVVTQRLTVLASSNHWRNTWLFAAGGVFAEKRHLREMLMSLFATVNQGDNIALAVRPAAHLAVDLLEENVADASPKFQKALAGEALELLRHHPDLHLKRLAEVLADVVERMPAVEDIVIRAVKDAFAASGRPALSALMVCATWVGGEGRLVERARAWLAEARTDLAQVSPRQRGAVAGLAATFPFVQLREFELTSLMARRRESISAAMDVVRQHPTLTQGDLPLVDRIIETLGMAEVERSHWPEGGLDVVRGDRSYRPDLSGLGPALDNQRVAAALIAAMDDVGLADWPIASMLRRALTLWVQRRPVTGLLPRAGLTDPGAWP